MPRRALPDGCLPRGLNEAQAAEYVGVGTTLFSQAVKDGRMPKPRRFGARKVWDTRQLDAAFDQLPVDGHSDDGPLVRL